MSDRGEFGMPGVGMFDIFEGSAMVEQVTLWPALRFSDHEMTVDYGEQGYTVPIVTEEARIAMSLLPDVLAKFLQRNSKYQEVQQGYDLGVEGIIPDLNRKLGILVSRLWHQYPESGSQEPTTEVIGDMIGHLLLMLAKMEE